MGLWQKYQSEEVNARESEIENGLSEAIGKGNQNVAPDDDGQVVRPAFCIGSLVSEYDMDSKVPFTEAGASCDRGMG
jgi:hypothetical protein